VASVNEIPVTASIVTPRTQIVVLLMLLLLTAGTVGVSFFDIPGRWHLAAGLSIAIAKSSLVVLFFMHVVHSPATTRVVIVVAIFWLVAVLLALTLCDYATRGIVPIPGH
jgi:cytochrome c oxidase subunit 4